MYSQNDLDEAVASGALSADAAAALRTFVDQQRATPAVDEEHFRLITGFNDIFVSIASAILLFAVGWIGQSIGQSLGLVDRRRRPEPARARWRSPRPPGAWRCSSPPSGAWRCRRSCCCWPSSAACSPPPASAWSSASASRQSIRKTMLARHRRLRSPAPIAAGAAWLHWKRFRVPITVAAGAAAVAAIAVGLLIAALGDAGRHREHHSRLRPAARHRRVPVRDALGFVGPGARHPPLRRRLLAPPAGGADDRPPGLHPARPQRRQRDHRRRAGRDRCSTSCSA